MTLSYCGISHGICLHTQKRNIRKRWEIEMVISNFVVGSKVSEMFIVLRFPSWRLTHNPASPTNLNLYSGGRHRTYSNKKLKSVEYCRKKFPDQQQQ